MLRTIVVCGHGPACDVRDPDTPGVAGLTVVSLLTDLLDSLAGAGGGGRPALQGRDGLP